MTLLGGRIAVGLAQRVEMGPGGRAAVRGVAELVNVETVFACWRTRETCGQQSESTVASRSLTLS